MTVITAPTNPLIVAAAQLHDARTRRASDTFLAEGRRVIDGFLRAGWAAEHLFIREDLELPATWPTAAVVRVGARVATKLSQATTASGYAAVIARRTPPELMPARGGLVLAGINDPGNLGTLLRSAAAFAVSQVVLLGGADPFAYKAVQASAGALPLLALHELDPATGLAPLAGGARCALVVSGGQSPSALPSGPRWLIVGGEANGIPDAWLADCEQRLTLPMPGGTESLNAAVAGAVALYALMSTSMNTGTP